jgi:hypothetical protein
VCSLCRFLFVVSVTVGSFVLHPDGEFCSTTLKISGPGTPNSWHDLILQDLIGSLSLSLSLCLSIGLQMSELRKKWHEEFEHEKKLDLEHKA